MLFTLNIVFFCHCSLPELDLVFSDSGEYLYEENPALIAFRFVLIACNVICVFAYSFIRDCLSCMALLKFGLLFTLAFVTLLLCMMSTYIKIFFEEMVICVDVAYVGVIRWIRDE